jgi:hypothetical protein
LVGLIEDNQVEQTTNLIDVTLVLSLSLSLDEKLTPSYKFFEGYLGKTKPSKDLTSQYTIELLTS